MIQPIITGSLESVSAYASPIPGDLLRPSDRRLLATDRASALSSKPEWSDAEYRHAYAEAAVEQGVAWQIRVNREARGLSQRELAARIGTHQSAVSRLEDPEHGRHTIPTLLKIAKAFDCALLIKLVPYSYLAWESEHLSPADLYAAPYSEELHSDDGSE